MKIIMGGRSQLLKGGLHLKADKLVKSGFKYKFPTVSSFLNKR
jgi:NAD dependent epimerase/dehydratase family enzyme